MDANRVHCSRRSVQAKIQNSPDSREGPSHKFNRRNNQALSNLLFTRQNMRKPRRIA
jgi:hypothetical protein